MVHSSGRDGLPGHTDKPENRSAFTLWIYRFIAFSSAMFILTILVMIAVTLSDPAVPLNRVIGEWLDRYSVVLIFAEIITIGVLVMIAFALDRRESWKRYHREYAEWERRMQQPAGKNGTNPETDRGAGAADSPGDAE